MALLPVVEGGVDGAGERLMRLFVSVWDDEQTRLPLLAVVRGILDPGGQQLVRDGFFRMVLGPVGVALGLDQPDRRMQLVASQLIGLVVLRYVLAVEPLASARARSWWRRTPPPCSATWRVRCRKATGPTWRTSRRNPRCTGDS